MRINYETKEEMLIPPASYATAAVSYNGATLISATGLDFASYKSAEVSISIGDVNASSDGITISFLTSTASSNPTGLLTAIADAVARIEVGDDSTIKTGKIRLDNLTAGHTYLYAKSEQTDTNAVAYGVNVSLSEGTSNPNDNTPVFDV